MAPSRLSKPGYKVLGGVALVALLWYGVPRLVGGLEFFKLRRVEVRGLVNLKSDQVVPRLPLVQGTSIFQDLDPVRRALDSIPGLEGASVRRRLPGTVVVTLREVAPVALVMRRGQLRPLGPHGEVLDFDPTVAAPDLPVVSEPDSLVAGLLGRLREADPGFFARIESGRRQGPDVVLIVSGKRYWFRPDAGAEVLRALAAVVQDLDKQGRRWAELDARFAGQVIVRWEAA